MWFPGSKDKLKSHIKTVHRDVDFNVTSIISQHHKRENFEVIKKFDKDRIYYCDKCGFLAARTN